MAEYGSKSLSTWNRDLKFSLQFLDESLNLPQLA